MPITYTIAYKHHWNNTSAVVNRMLGLLPAEGLQVVQGRDRMIYIATPKLEETMKALLEEFEIDDVQVILHT